MRLDTFIMLCLGLLIEILSLWEIARHEHGTTTYLSYLPHWLNPERVVMLALTLIAFLTIGLFRLEGINEISSGTTDALLMPTAVAAGLFAFYFGLLHPFLLPRVNEQMLFTLYVTLGAGALLGGDLDVISSWGLLGMGTFGALLFWASVSEWRLPLGIQAVTYLGYLSAVYWVGYRQINTLVNAPSTILMPLDGFILGVGSIFIVLHALFWMRFFLIVSSMILPNHWRYLNPIMSHLFADTQNSLKDVALSLGSTLGLLLVNRLTGAMPVSLFLSLLVPLTVQGLNHLRWQRASK